jgi:HEPN domain-containing protein
MTNREQVHFALERARVILEEARSLQAKGVWNLVVRRAQEVVELALKGALQWAGLEVPRLHDVGRCCG